jgi:N-methylhydantoinase A
VGVPLGLATGVAAYGVVEIVDENMANAARVHAVERGLAVRDHVLVAFGGAAPLHALAEKLAIDRIIVPADAGVGSAIGFLRAPAAYGWSEAATCGWMDSIPMRPTTFSPR